MNARKFIAERKFAKKDKGSSSTGSEKSRFTSGSQIGEEGRAAGASGFGVNGNGVVGLEMPDFAKKGYIDPPSGEDMQRAFPNHPSIQRAYLELNVSRVLEGSIEKLLEWISYMRFFHRKRRKGRPRCTSQKYPIFCRA